MKTISHRDLLLLGIALISVACTKTYTQEEIDRLFTPITSKYGIKIVYKIDANFPPILTWGGEPAQFDKASQIDHHAAAKYPRILEKAFGKYPKQLIKNHLNSINFAKELEHNGLKYGGAYDRFRRIVYLADDGRRDEDKSEYIFHHEFSSILLKSRFFLLSPWFEQNPKGYKYLQDQSDDWSSKWREKSVSDETSSKVFEKGFLTDYSETSFENDFNEYSAMIFTYPQKFKMIMNQNPRVRGKFLIWLKFYQEIDPIFTETYLLGGN